MIKFVSAFVSGMLLLGVSPMAAGQHAVATRQTIQGITSGEQAAQAQKQSRRQSTDLLSMERAATGGQAWNEVVAIAVDGKVTEGGVVGSFHKIVDWRTGHTTTQEEMGPMVASHGFDGTPWVAANGIVNSIDLPALVQDAKSEAFLDCGGWRNATAHVANTSDPQGIGELSFQVPSGSPIRMTFDGKTHLVSQAVIDSDDGPLTVLYSDWRPVGKVKFPFRQEEKDNTGEVTIYEIQKITLLPSVPRGELARPKMNPHGRLIGNESTRVPLIYLSAKSYHVEVAAKVQGTDTLLLFDTGAANYFSPTAAKRFGLDVAGGINLSGVGESSISGGYASVKTISVGSAELANEVAVIAPLPFPARGGAPEGFIGYEFLSEFQTVFDYPNKTLTFSSFDSASPAEGVSVPFFSDGHSIYIEAVVDGQTGIFRLDTGDGGTITVFPAFAKKYGLYQNAAGKKMTSGGVGGNAQTLQIVVSRFKLADTTFHDFAGKLSLSEAGAFATRSLAGNLGGGLLHCFKITFDYRARTVTFAPAKDQPGECAKSDFH